MTKNKCGCNQANDPSPRRCKKHRGRGEASGLLKFSGLAQTLPNASSTKSYLADVPTTLYTSKLSYGAATPRSFENLTVTPRNAFTTGSIVVRLLRNGTAVPGYSVTLLPSSAPNVPIGQIAGPVGIDFNDTFDLEAEAIGVDVIVSLSATIGVGPRSAAP